MYAGGGPGEVVRKRANKVRHMETEAPHEWVLLEDPEARDGKFSKFWWNRLTGCSQWEEPAWDKEWEVRKGRSERTQEFGDWYEMYDKAIDSVFYVNDRFNKTQWKSPFS